LLGDFSAKVGGEDIFKPTVGNESLQETTGSGRMISWFWNVNKKGKYILFKNVFHYKKEKDQYDETGNTV
jgi:hypothetical protein